MGSRRTGSEKIYAAAQAWVERGLLADDSLFTPGRAIWTPGWLAELRRRFLDQPGASGNGFWGKLENQLANSPPEVYQLLGEVLFVHFLILSSGAMKSDTKINRIKQVLGWSAAPTEIPADLNTALAQGITHPGGFFIAGSGLGFVIELAEHLKKQETAERSKVFNDPWEFKRFAENLQFRSVMLRGKPNSASSQRNAIYHLIFPDYFEAITSNDHKHCIATEFARLVTERTADVDRQIMQIRPKLEAEHGSNIHLYEPHIEKLWNPKHQDYKPRLVRNEPLNRGNQPYDEEKGLAALAASLYLDAAFLQEVDILLKDKRQVIFQGPPGTGKTFVARALARHLAGGSDDRVTLAQFHPSYAYEDFVQGYRPAIMGNGQAGFELRDGPLVRAAQRAESEPAARHFLVIDEINRGNLAKVFGELYFLLEYRDAKIDLQYGGERFSLPDNLYIIGTMNTADRSIAMVDLALRRRFHFVEFHPDKPPIRGLLGRYLADKAVGMEWVADVVDRANELLRDDRNAAIGPSHFMKCGLDDDAVRRTWKYSVLPYIEERLLGDPQGRLDDFDLDTLQRQAMASAAGASADGANESGGNPADADDESPTADA